MKVKMTGTVSIAIDEIYTMVHPFTSEPHPVPTWELITRAETRDRARMLSHAPCAPHAAINSLSTVPATAARTPNVPRNTPSADAAHSCALGRLVEWYERYIEVFEGGQRGQGEGRKRVSRQQEGGRRRSRARVNGAKPYLIAYRDCGDAGGVTTKVESENCARGGIAGGCGGGGQQRVARRGVGGRG